MAKTEKHDVIIRAALELIAEHGFHGAPMAMIAERAGVAAGTIYRYFESKDVLIRDAYGCLEGQIMASVMAEYPKGRPIRERFLHVWQRLANYFLASPLELRFIEQFHNSPYGVACRRDRIFGKKDKDIITKLFDEAREQQIIKDLPLPVLLALTFSPLADLCRDHILQFIILDDALITRTAEACWDALKR
jgi:AcrR family transcriptional regulator